MYWIEGTQDSRFIMKVTQQQTDNACSALVSSTCLLLTRPSPRFCPSTRLSLCSHLFLFSANFQKKTCFTLRWRPDWFGDHVKSATQILICFFFPLISLMKWTKQKRRRSRRPLPSQPNLDVLGRISQINQIFPSSHQEEPSAGGGARYNQLSTARWR